MDGDEQTPKPAYGEYAPGYAPGEAKYGTVYGQQLPAPRTPEPTIARRLTFGELFSLTFRSVLHYPWALWVGAVVINLALGFASYFWYERALDGLVNSMLANPASPDFAGVSAALPSIAIGLVGAALLGDALAAAIFIPAVFAMLRVQRGDRQAYLPSIGELWKTIGSLAAWLVLFKAAQIALLAIVLGLALLLIPLGPVGIGVGAFVGIVGSIAAGIATVFVGVKFALVPAATVAERRGVISAIKRSWRLTTGQFWMTFGLQVLPAGIISVVGQFVIAPISAAQAMTGGITGTVPTQAPLLVLILSAIVTTTVLLVETSALVALYDDSISPAERAEQRTLER